MSSYRPTDLFPATKLFAPRLGSSHIARPRLSGILDRIAEYRLILIDAPAGYGKTSLLSEWAAGLDGANIMSSQVSWLSLDETDGNPSLFYLEFISALQHIGYDVPERVLDNLMRWDADNAHECISDIVNVIAQSGLSQGDLIHTVMVIDDLHFIANESITNSLSYLIKHIPSHFHFICTTRGHVPLTFIALKGKQQLLEIEAANLKFTDEEAVQFFLTRTGVRLPEQKVKEIQRHLEGWPIGWQFLSLSAQDDDAIESLLSRRNYQSKDITEYFAFEIFSDVPGNTKDFLLATSILDRFCASLSDYVLDLPSSSERIIAQLLQTDIFLVELDKDGMWFRYQGLFADFLRDSFRPTESLTREATFRRAAEWHESNNMPLESLKYAVKAKDEQLTAELLIRHYRKVISRGLRPIFETCLSSLSRDTFDAYPFLYVIKAWSESFLFNSLEVDRCVELARLASEDLSNEERKLIFSELLCIKAAMECHYGDPSIGIQLAEEAYDAIEHDDTFLHSYVKDFVSLAKGRLSGANSHLNSMSYFGVLETRPENYAEAQFCLLNLGRQYERVGKLHTAAESYEKAFSLESRHLSMSFSSQGPAYIGMGHLYYEWNNLTLSEKYYKKGIEQLERAGYDLLLVEGYIGLASLRQAQGRMQEATEALAKATSSANICFSSKPKLQVDTKLFKLMLACDIEPTAQLINDIERAIVPESDLELTELKMSSIAHIRLHEGKYEEMTEILQELIRRAEALGHNGSLVEWLVLFSIGQYRRRKYEKAAEALFQALSLGRDEGYLRVFLDFNRDILPVLEKLIGSRTVEEQIVGQEQILQYARDIQRILTMQKHPGKPINVTDNRDSQTRRNRPIEFLTNRETEVFDLILQGLSNKDIAGALVVSINTVKTHRGNVYRKYGVQNVSGLMRKVYSDTR